MDLCKDGDSPRNQPDFFISISRLPSGLQEAVASTYLCMRAIDEIEDHPNLDNPLKAKLLQTISSLQTAADASLLMTSTH